jgi:hypothetical protein
VDGDGELTGGDDVPPVEGDEDVDEVAGRLAVPVGVDVDDVDVDVDGVDVDEPVGLTLTCACPALGTAVNCW